MEENLRKDIESIIGYSRQFAEIMLNDGKEYYPFGVEIDTHGELRAIGYKGDHEFPKSSEIIQNLKNEFKILFEKEEIRAYGITYDVKVEINDFGDKSDAICMDIKHRDNSDLPKYYFTYSWNENDKLIFGKSFGMK